MELTYTKFKGKSTLNLVFGFYWSVRISSKIFLCRFFKTLLDFSCPYLSVELLHFVLGNDVHFLVDAQIGFFLVQLVKSLRLEWLRVLALRFFVD